MIALSIGPIPNAEQSEHWPALRALLEPSAKRGGVLVLEEHELVWGVFDNGAPIAAATARITVEDICEIVLVGGHDYPKWIGELDRRIGACATEAGATAMRAWGRRGWKPILSRQGWAVTGERVGLVAYERELRH